MRRLFSFLLILCSFFCVYAGAPHVVAHRGYHRADGSAQNSIRALVKSDSIHAEKCEFDVWISADDVLYVNHNSDINGVVIQTSTSEVIDTCRLANGEIIPRLEAFLDTARHLDIDLVLEVKPHKNVDRENVAVDKILEMVKDKGLIDRTTYISFSRNACRRLAEGSSNPVYFLSAATVDELKDMGCAGADFNLSVFRTHPEWIDELHAAGMPVNIWTVDAPEDIRHCISIGADFITTNEPELAQKLIAESYAPRQLKIMTYNLRFGELASMERLAEEIKARNPDFVALQEVDVNSRRTAARHNNDINFVNELAYRTGMFGYFGKSLDFSPENGYYGVAILSKYPAKEIKTIALPNPKKVEPRVLLKGLFLLEGDMPFVFASTHFDFTSSDTQLLQAQAIYAALSGDSIPTVVGGDFNAEPGSPAIDFLKERFALLSGDAPTFPSKEPQKRLDYLFGLPRQDFRLIETSEGLSSPYAASDHLPVISTVLFTR